MRKKLLFFLLTALFALPSAARNFKYEYEGQTIIYSVIDEDTKTVKTAINHDITGDLILPSNPKDGETVYTLAEIADESFTNCEKLNSVIIPNSVHTIGNGAFSFCYNLTSISIPNSVHTIGNGAFSNLYNLTSVIIPNSVTEISNNAFRHCDNLKKAAYPSTITNPFGSLSAIAYNPEGAIIEDGWIYGPDKNSILFAPISLEGDYTIPGNVTEIGTGAFSYCSGLTSVIIPTSVTQIGSNVFSECDLVKVAYPSTITNPFSKASSTIAYNPEGAIIEDGWIYGPDKNSILFAPISLEGDYTIPGNVTEIGTGVFSYCSGLTSVIIPNSVTKIGGSAFRNCEGLTSLIIPNSVTKIGNMAFYNCKGLTSVIIPNSVTEIMGGTFWACHGLTSVSIPTSVTRIGAEAFSGCIGLTSVSIPTSVTEIGREAFSYSGLTSVLIPSSVTEIGDYAFTGCSKLLKKAYPNTINFPFENSLVCLEYDPETDIVEEGWIYNNDKTAILFVPLSFKGDYTIPDSVTEIGDIAFSYCLGLTSISIPNSVTKIGYHAFLNCKGLTSLMIPSSVTEIGSKAFTYCNKVTSLTIYSLPSSCDFSSLENLNEINYITDDVMEGSKNIFYYSTYYHATLFVKEKVLNEIDLYSPWLYFEKVEAKDFNAGVEDIIASPESGIDPNAPMDIYTLDGKRISSSIDNLAPGIYIVRQGKIAKKIAVK
ncbi:MAG: leucine-rich repeat domain-containing protein [Muribaculaceae bacterium]|nr:leucine-rich repeat domain-containing protein [Muribaculaceae bacterium]